MEFIACSLIGFLVVLFVSYANGGCPNGYVAFRNDACFMFKHEQEKIIGAIEAQQICREKNGTLATIDNADQDKWLLDTFMHDKKILYTVWIGLTHEKYRNNDVWIWQDGSKSKYRKWNRSKPDHNSANEDCVHYDVSYVNESYPSLGWNDDVCNDDSYRTQGYICRTPFRKVQGPSILCASSSEDTLLKTTGWAIGGSIGTAVILIMIIVLGVFVSRKFGICFRPTVPLTRFENE